MRLFTSKREGIGVRRFLIPSISVGSVVIAAIAPSSQKRDPGADILPVLNKYCARCHGNKDNQDMALPSLLPADSFRTKRELWNRIEAVLSNKQMPPPGNPAPSDSERASLVSSIERAVSAGSPDRDNRMTPGRVTMRRLNREEYNNTIRDLFGIDLRPADDFPSDDVGYGFDNIGDVLSISPLLMEKYLKAATVIADRVIYTPGVRTWRFAGTDLDGPNATALADGVNILFTNGVLTREIDLPVEADYDLGIEAHQDKAGPEDARMSLVVNGRTIDAVAVRSTGKPELFQVRFHAGPGHVVVGAGFTNDFYVAKTATAPQQDRNLYIHALTVSGPVGPATAIPRTQSRIIFEQPTPATRLKCERDILASLAGRAYRRPPTGAEVDKLVAIAEMAHQNRESFERGIQLGVTAVLCSPNFLFRVERPIGDSLNSYEIASRLSYFLWSSMPDDPLYALAAKDLLKKPDVLAQQIQRMLSDRKSDALADNFAGQWLQTRKLGVVRLDRRLFPQYTNEVRQAMATETRMFFQDVVRNDRSVLDFLEGSHTFVNGPLAQVYGIPGVSGPNFMRVQLPPERAGILTQGSVLVVTSNPTRTSPVKRGKWILENILGTPPPPPPPGVGVLKDDRASVATASLKERMEQHRKDPMCAACHKQMDGLGFALENFDASGTWRTKDGQFDIDASGELPDGSKFAGPTELRSILVARKGQFVKCLSEKMLTFALGRGLEPSDDPAVAQIVKSVSDGQYKFSSLVTAIVASEPFRKQGREK